MTVPQHRPGGKEPTDRVPRPARRATRQPKGSVQQNAGGPQPLAQRLVEKRRQRVSRMPHCLKGDVLFLISFPWALSPGRSKALAPHWTEQTASLPQGRGTLWWLKPWGQEAVTKGEEKVSKKKSVHSRPAGRCSGLALQPEDTVTGQDHLLQNTAP